MTPSMMLLGISMLGAGAMFMLLLALRSLVIRNRSTSVAAALTRAGIAKPDLRALKTSRPASERLFKPLLRRLYRKGRSLTPSRTIEQLQHNLILAGLPGGLTVTDFLGLRFLAGASVALLLFTMMAVRESASTGVLYGSIAFLVGLYLPNFWLHSKVKSRQKAIARALPDALDMMSICVDAGLGFEAAIQKVGYQWDNELALELRRVISEIRVGVPRADALRHLAERTGVQEIASFVAVLVQADRLGIAIRNVLNTQSIQMRIRRRQLAQEEARKAPLKMMIPLVLFIFPALFAVVLGPAIPRMMQAFS
jgi:tight adherence protein C